MTGVQFLEIYHRKRPYPPPTRIILSGYSPSEEIKLAKKYYSLYAFVLKPCDMEKLKQIIDEGIEAGLEHVE